MDVTTPLTIKTDSKYSINCTVILFLFLPRILIRLSRHGNVVVHLAAEWLYGEQRQTHRERADHSLPC